MYISRITVPLVLTICLISTVANSILPQDELRELDIFMQDEEYKEVHRMKRTDEDIFEDGSGEVPPATTDLINENEHIFPDMQNITLSLTPENSPQESPAIDNTEVIANPDVIDESLNNGYFDVTTLEPILNTEIFPSIVASRGVISGDDVDGAINADITDVDGTTNNATSENFSSINSTNADNTTGVDVAFNNSTNSANSTTGDIDGAINNSTTINNSTNSANFTSTNSTNANNTTGIDVTINNSTNNVNSTIGGPGVSKINSTVTNTVREISNNNKAVQSATTEKPGTVKSDETKQSTVSGSGVLFTIIILVVVAGLAALGYVIYKRRKGGYDPVNVEDTDKEMIEIKTDNGFGKPITEDEVRLDNRLTPVEPLVAPKSFAVQLSDEKKMDEEEAKEDDKSEVETRGYNDESKKYEDH